MGKSWIAFLSGTLIIALGGMIVFFLQSPVEDAMNAPEVIAVAMYGEKICPDKLSFKTLEEVSPFAVTIQNIGEDGMATIEISSDKLESRATDVDEFSDLNKKEAFLSAKSTKVFKFEVSPEDKLANLDEFDVTLNYGCYEKVVGKTFTCDEKIQCCKYKKQSRDTFQLVSQTC